MLPARSRPGACHTVLNAASLVQNNRKNLAFCVLGNRVYTTALASLSSQRVVSFPAITKATAQLCNAHCKSIVDSAREAEILGARPYKCCRVRASSCKNLLLIAAPSKQAHGANVANNTLARTLHSARTVPAQCPHSARNSARTVPAGKNCNFSKLAN